MTTARRLARLTSLLLGVLLAATAGGQARAQSVSLVAGNSLTLGSLVFTVSNCTITAGAAGTTCASEVLGPDPNYSGPGIGVVIESSSGATTPFLSATACGSSCPTVTRSSPNPYINTYDMSLTLEVFAASNTVSMSAISQGITGYDTPDTVTSEQQVSVGETVENASAVTLTSLQSDLSSPSHSVAFAPQTCTVSTACFYLTKDIALSVAGAPNGTALGIYTVSQALIPAPEPSSVATFLVGLTILGLMRRRSKMQDSI